MDSYTITITPNDDSGNSTTLVVDTTDGQVRITDMRLHAADGLAGGTMPTVDISLLLRAVGTMPSEPPRMAATPAPAPAPAEAETPTADHVDATPPARAARARAAAPATEPTRPRRARAAKAAATPETGRRSRRGSAEGPANSAATKRAAKKAATPATSSGRAYRRMPEDFSTVYAQSSSPAAIAEHYGVPRHTAQGWIRRIKAGS